MRERARDTQIVALALGLGLAVAVVAAARPAENKLVRQARGSEPAHVAIAGTDYAFVQLPATLSPGPTLFSFENRGAKRHEMSIALLRPGVTLDSITSGTERVSVASRAIADSIIGLLIARPGERSGGQLYANLIAGRRYIVICTLKDTPESRPHADLGMIGTFQVR